MQPIIVLGIKPLLTKYQREALKEAMERYPSSIEGLIFFIYASGLNEGEYTQEVLDTFKH